MREIRFRQSQSSTESDAAILDKYHVRCMNSRGKMGKNAWRDSMKLTRLICQRTLSPGQKLILLYLTDPEYQLASMEKHADFIRISARWFRNGIKVLKDQGFIEVEPGARGKRLGNDPNTYRVTEKGWALFRD
jgi:hypothetical protein